MWWATASGSSKRTMNAQRYTFFFIVAAALFVATTASADDFKDFAELNLEELLNTEIMTASRQVQKLYDQRLRGIAQEYGFHRRPVTLNLSVCLVLC